MNAAASDGLRFEGAAPAPSAERVAAFEAFHEVALPADYVALLARANGAVPSRRVLAAASGPRAIDRFLALLDRPPRDHELGWAAIDVVMTQLDGRIAVDEDAVDAALVPIAALVNGDMACLDYRMPGVAGVVLWDHEASEELAPVTEPLAPSVTALLDLLRD